jgi:thymidylate synthase (FAD)
VVNDIVGSVEELSQTILDKGIVSLKNFMGGDLAVVAAARVSNGESYEDASHGEEADFKLIRYLVKNRHGTPFEHSTFQFYVKTPLFVRSEWHRHRIASYNEISGRYVKYEPEFYLPTQFRTQGKTNKQGSQFPTEAPEGYPSVEYWNTVGAACLTEASAYAYATYQSLLELGVAKEMARMVLPPNLYTQFYMTVNARALMNFLSLRCADNAQWEIRQYALAMKEMFKAKMPLTFQAWEENGYIAP